MNRIAQFTLIIALSFSQHIIAADMSVPDIEQKITVKQSEYDNYNNDLEAEMAKAKQYENDLADLRKNATLAEADRQSALIEMNLQYEQVIDNPELDITPVREKRS